MTDKSIEKELLKLNPDSRAKLANKLLSSLEELSEEGIEILWLEEAIKRNQELKTRKVKAKSAETVLKNARSRIK